ncbi:mannose-specific lectin-like [Poecilia latipinna]|uniref:Mannose-specific lectin-like n=1 Tax=Poecilia latipinna TaxID=48699 RepID=A0A3B3VP11_9TELE|nr:PREDICTED: mannose-specific lectin-like [Poecilia latipinna]
MSRNYLSHNDELRKGDYLLSNNREWKAIFQNDGNFVIYGWKPIWASDTCGSDAVRLIMQADCNLVMYNNSDTPRWHTNSYQQGSHVGRVQLTDDGKLLVYKDSHEIWSSANSKGMK